MPKILIVDDHRESCEQLADMLSPLGMECLFADSGVEALRMAEAREFVLIILDAQMPDMDGHRVLNQISSNDELCHVPVLLLTANFADQRNPLHSELSAVDYVFKPVNPSLLCEKAKNVLNMESMRHAVDRFYHENQKALEAPDEGILALDHDGRIVFANPAAVRLLGTTLSRLLKVSIETLLESDEYQVVSNWHEHVLYQNCAKGKPVHVKKAVLKRGDGADIYTRLSAHPVDDETDVDIVIEFKDVGEILLSGSSPLLSAQYDSLTGLLNRKKIEQQLDMMLSTVTEYDRTVAVLFLGLDHFKNINDSLGHDFGDQLLKNVSNRLKENLLPAQLLARLGGDEFVILLPNLPSPKEAAAISVKLIRVLERPFLVEGHEIFIGASVGIATYPHCGDNKKELIRNADTALHRAKENGRHKYEFYTQEMNRQHLHRLELETSLHHALERDEFFIEYLPIYDLSDGSVEGVEALVRWQSQDYGLVEPLEFIPLAEESGLISGVGDWVINTACEQRMKWASKFGEGKELIISVNVSEYELLTDDFVPLVSALLQRLNLPPQFLEIEIAEASLSRNVSQCVRTLQKLCELGVKVVLDDFGTALSSVNFLRHVDLWGIKIDQEFIRNLAVDKRDAQIVESIIALAHNLNMKVIAEGVEHVEQLRILKDMGCDRVQGFYCSKPLSEQEVSDILESGLVVNFDL